MQTMPMKTMTVLGVLPQIVHVPTRHYHPSFRGGRGPVDRSAATAFIHDSLPSLRCQHDRCATLAQIVGADDVNSIPISTCGDSASGRCALPSQASTQQCRPTRAAGFGAVASILQPSGTAGNGAELARLMGRIGSEIRRPQSMPEPEVHEQRIYGKTCVQQKLPAANRW